MILKPDIAGVGTWPAYRFIPLLAFGHLLRAVEFVHLLAVEENDSLLPVQGDVHRIPFARRLLRTFRRPGKLIEGAGGVPFIAALLDLDFVAVMHPVPGILRFFRQANEDA